MWIVEDLENAIDIVDLVQKYTSVKKAGTNYKWLCPFPGHSEKTPSFMVSPAKQIAYCFGCHKWWGPLKFVMDIENSEFKEALEVLGNLTWIETNTNFDKEKFKVKKNMYSLHRDASNYYKDALKRYPEIKKYLFDRWINEKSIEDFHIWYSDSWVWLYNYLKEKWYDDDDIEKSKIFIDLKQRKDKFIWRVIFPIQNSRWDFVAFTARITWEWEPKYLNSPATDIYDKSSILYWLYTARNSITKEWYIIITEWNADTIALQQFGFFNTVAISGTALTEKHLTIIKRLTHKIYLCFDSDKAWISATKLAIELMKNKWFELRVISLKWWKDPDEILQKKWKETFEKLINEAKTPIWFYIEKNKFDLDSIEDKKNLLNELIDIISSYSDNLEKDYFLKEISALLNISENVVYDTYNKTRFKNLKRPEQNNKNKSLISGEDFAIAYIIYQEKSVEEIKKLLIFPEYIWNDLKKIIESIENLSKFDLNKKEKYRWIALQIEEEEKLKTEDSKWDVIGKICKKINLDIFKKMTTKLKEEMSKWDEKAFIDYTNLIKKAKKSWIK